MYGGVIGSAGLALAFVVAGCGGASTSFVGDGGGAGGDLVAGLTADEACAAEAAAGCSRLDACRTNGVTLRYGTMDVCVQRNKQSCLAGLAAHGSGATPVTRAACTAATLTATCQSFLDNTIPECQPQKGSLADGTACAFPAQCQSGFCAFASGVGCGKCAAAPAPGASCAQSQCDRLQFCDSRLMTCQSLSAAGGPCSGRADCVFGLECAGATANATGVCVMAATMGGTACDRKVGPGCNYQSGLACVAPVGKSAGTCMAYQYATAGSACGLVAGSDVLCTGGALCYGATALAPGLCKGPAAEGAPCDTAAGPPCMTPARCITGGTGTAGTCKLNDASQCM